MKHKDEIWVCRFCLNITSCRSDDLKCIRCGEYNTVNPYLPSSSVKELVEAAKRMNNYVKEYSGSEMSVQFELLSKNIDYYLKPFEKE